MSQAGILDVIDNNPQIPTLFVEDVGFAIPIANTLNIFGAGGITTSGSGNTVTIDGSGVGGTEEFIVDAHTAPGTNPVVPNGAKQITVTGGQVAAGTTTNVIRTDSLAANTYTIEVQRSQAVLASTIGDNGVSHFNSNHFTVDPNAFVSLSGAVGLTITGDTGGPLPPSAGNWNIFGGNLSAGLNASTTSGSGSTLTITSINCSKWIVDPTANRGTHQTIAGAIAAASSGDVIFVKPGNYVENITINKSLQFFSFQTITSSFNQLPQIAGTLSISSNDIKVGFTGFGLFTNGSACLSVTGNNTNVMINNCAIGALDGTGIAITGSSTTNVNLNGCYSTLAGANSLFTTTNGNITFQNCIFKATGGGGYSASTTSAGTVSLFNTQMAFPITTSSTGVIFAYGSQFGFLPSAANDLLITTAGTATNNKLINCAFYSGTSSCVSIGAGTAITMTNCTCESSNTNVLTGAGTLNYAFIAFSGSSSGHNVTTETALATLI